MRQSTLVALLGFLLLSASSAWAQAPAGQVKPADVPPSLPAGENGEGASPSDLLPPSSQAVPPRATNPAPQTPAAPALPSPAAYAPACPTCRPYVPCSPPACCRVKHCGRRCCGYVANVCVIPTCCGPAYHAAPGYYPAAMTAPAIWRYR
jgi:hypothetical protein